MVGLASRDGTSARRSKPASFGGLLLLLHLCLSHPRRWRPLLCLGRVVPPLPHIHWKTAVKAGEERGEERGEAGSAQETVEEAVAAAAVVLRKETAAEREGREGQRAKKANKTKERGRRRGGAQRKYSRSAAAAGGGGGGSGGGGCARSAVSVTQPVTSLLLTISQSPACRTASECCYCPAVPGSNNL